MAVANRPDPIEAHAVRIVDKAIANKGDVASIKTAAGTSVRSFEDTISPAIFADYVADALVEVDADNWMHAHEIARGKAIGRTAITLRNQE